MVNVPVRVYYNSFGGQPPPAELEANGVPPPLAACASSPIFVFQGENWLRYGVGCRVPTHPSNPHPHTGGAMAKIPNSGFAILYIEQSNGASKLEEEKT